MTAIGIKYRNEFLDLAPNQSIEIERSNPMFAIEAAAAEYSTTVSVIASDKNIRLLGNIFLDLDAKSKVKYAVEFYDNGNYTYNATLILDKSRTNRRFYEKSIAEGYLLIGQSKFFNELKNRKATSLEYDRQSRWFNFTTFAPYDGSNGYWQHFHDTWNNNADYILAPIHNNDWYGDTTNWASNFYSGFMNEMASGQLVAGKPLAIQPRVSYIMRKLIEENGWSFDDSEMIGTDWERLFLVNFNPFTYYFDFIANSQFTNLQIQLANCISPELTCSDLFFELCKHYGWVPLCNNDSDHCKLVPLKNGSGVGTGGGKVVDLTAYSGDEVDNDFSGTLKTFSFKNEFPSNDSSISSFDIKSWKIETPVFKFSDLPFPSGLYDLSAIFVYVENKYYRIDLDIATNTREWVVAGDNIYDVDVPDNVETVTSKVTTLPMYRTKWREVVGDARIKYYGFFPYCKQSQFKEFGIRTLLYLGMATEEREDGNPGTYTYPQLSSIRCLHDGTEVAMFSNVFSHINPTTGVDLGIIPYWFKVWTTLVANIETNEEDLLLPLHKFRELNWNDEILLFNIPYIFKSFTEPRPYENFIKAKMQRITAPPPNVGVPSGGGLTGKIYVKLVLRDILTGQTVVIPDFIFGPSGTTATQSNLSRALVVAEFYSEITAINKLKVAAIKLLWGLITEYNGVATDVGAFPLDVTNAKEAFYPFISFTNGRCDLEYDLVNSGASAPSWYPQDGHYKRTYYIGTSADYEIIP